MGRVRKAKKIGVKLRLSEELHAKVALLLLDPKYGRAKWGTWTDLGEALFQRWVNEQQELAHSGSTTTTIPLAAPERKPDPEAAIAALTRLADKKN